MYVAGIAFTLNMYGAGVSYLILRIPIFQKETKNFVRFELFLIHIFFFCYFLGRLVNKSIWTMFILTTEFRAIYTAKCLPASTCVACAGACHSDYLVLLRQLLVALIERRAKLTIQMPQFSCCFSNCCCFGCNYNLNKFIAI